MIYTLKKYRPQSKWGPCENRRNQGLMYCGERLAGMVTPLTDVLLEENKWSLFQAYLLHSPCNVNNT